MYPGAPLILSLVALIVPAFFVLTWIVSGYNRLLALRKAYTNAYTRVDLELKRRYEVILDLVEAAKASLDADRGMPEAVLAARRCAVAARERAARTPGEPVAMEELSGAEAALNATLSRLLPLLDAAPVGGRNYPPTRKLRQELSSTDENVESARLTYNDATMSYNAVRATFPNSIIAAPFGFVAAEPFACQKVPVERGSGRSKT